MLSCDDVRDSYSALLDQEVDPEYREVLEAHLFQCADCLRTLAKYKAVSDLYRELPRPETEYDFERAVLQRLDKPADSGMRKPGHRLALYLGAGLILALVAASTWYALT
ncbi:MAG: zf-HC2 domain-containing protein [Candidatus Hydrogenedentes bacterium]|nr:zf-HC2 domain-containing protein [Candidatus Hydrogenedentota bacterium]